MKTLSRVVFFCLLLFTFCLSAYPQNLVPNPSFEDTTVGCPTLQDQVDLATGWTSYGGSPDYFNACAPAWTGFSVPHNWGGYQPSSSGNAYCALGTYAPCCPNNREYIGAELPSALQEGTKYFVSFQTSLSVADTIESYVATNKMGVLLATKAYTSSSPPSTVNNFAHIFSDSIVIDTMNWTRVFGSFTADSAYTNIIIGNFFDDMNTDTIIFIDSQFSFAYYFIDDICISTDSAFCAEYVYTGTDYPQKKDRLIVYPNPTVDFLHVEIENSFQPFTVKVYNVLGQTIFQGEGYEELTIDLINASKGILLVQVNYSNRSITTKILKK